MATLSAMTSEALDAPPRASSHRPLLVLFNLLVFGGVGGAMAWRRLAVE